MAIHPTALIDAGADVDPTAEIGPYCVVESGVRVGARTRLRSHVVLCRGARIGADCDLHPFVVIADLPQDLAHGGGASYVEIGDGCILREHVTIHRGTETDSTTRIGSKCYLMAGAHVAHNCQVGDEVIMANAVLLAGRVTVGRKCFLGGNAGVHQFVRIGEFAMIRGLDAVFQDVAPFMTMAKNSVIGPNVVGLRRAGFTAAERHELRTLYKSIFRSGGSFRQAVAAAAGKAQSAPAKRFVEFLSQPSKRGYARFRTEAEGIAVDAR